MLLTLCDTASWNAGTVVGQEAVKELRATEAYKKQKIILSN